MATTQDTPVADESEIAPTISSPGRVWQDGIAGYQPIGPVAVESGITLHLAEIKGPVMEKLKETVFYRNMKGRVFFTTDVAMRELASI